MDTISARPHVRILRLASPRCEELLAKNIDSLAGVGLRFSIHESKGCDPSWPYTAGDPKSRAKSLLEAIGDEDVDIILNARGGYGCSDVLPLLPWQDLERLKPKTLVGFSDTSALHSALFTMLGWRGLHAPMPATELWNTEASDVGELLRLLTQLPGGTVASQIDINPWIPSTHPSNMEGWLFGGCMSVLTNLIGTPYFPKSLEGAILFLEDTDEAPPKLLRYWNQWIQSGALRGVKSLILGHFRNCGVDRSEFQRTVVQQIHDRAPLPIYTTENFGHTTPNYPLMIGSMATITDNCLLNWKSTQRRDHLVT